MTCLAFLPPLSAEPAFSFLQSLPVHRPVSTPMRLYLWSSPAAPDVAFTTEGSTSATALVERHVPSREPGAITAWPFGSCVWLLDTTF